MKLILQPEDLAVGKDHDFTALQAGTSKDCEIRWIYSGAHLEVFSSETNEIKATCSFGKVLRDPSTAITNVKDFKIGGLYFLLVAVSNSSDLGQLCIFRLGLRKVVQVIEIPQRITALEVVFSNTGDDEIPKWILSKHLQFFCGLAAVGTVGGYIYLLDLCLDRIMLQKSTEERPRKLMIISPSVVDAEAKRQKAFSYDKNIAVLLDEECHVQGQYYYRRQDDTVQKAFDEDDVQVTCLKYLDQTGILAVGFNFGSFQLWKLYNPVLDYSSRFASHNMQVVKFVVQEPENDPRNFVYLWVIHDDESGENVANGGLYQLCFAKKDVYAGFGLFYDELDSVCIRLEHKFTVDPYSKDAAATWNSSLITCFTLLNPSYMPPTTLSESFDEGLTYNDQSLSVFVWKAEGKQGASETKHWMAVFDLNRWYHAQMPQTIRCIGSSLQVCPFWAVYSLDQVCLLSPTHALLNVEVCGDRVLRFFNNSPLPPEEHSFPSALKLLNVRFVTSGKVIKGECNGWQGQLLRQFIENGSEYLVNPADFYYQCLRARLLPQSYLEEKVKGPEYQREILLNMALERGLACSLVSACIQKWADGELTEQGCTLTMLHSWAWRRVADIKDSWHLACEVLYDNLGYSTDARTIRQLNSLTSRLTQLKRIFSKLIAHSGPTTDKGQQELEVRFDTINILLKHFEIVEWFVSVHLLPELDSNVDGDTSDLFVYPRKELEEFYTRRRAELHNKKCVLDSMSLLLIDELVVCQGPAIKKLWESINGNGEYPPSSLQGIVSMYLLEDVSLDLKNAITLYLLQDLADMIKTDASQRAMGCFVDRFFLSHSLVHQAQALWFIDHKDFEEGLRHLANPTVYQELCINWRHVTIVNTLLAQSEDKVAIRFLHTKSVFMNSPLEQCLYISVLIANKQLDQALQYLRTNPTVKIFQELMFHLVKECQRKKLIGHLLLQYLTEREEKLLEQYLRHTGDAHALEPLFLYYLHKSRFLQAYQLNQDMNKMEKMEAFSGSNARTITRNRLMEAYLSTLPDCAKELLLEKKSAATPAVKKIECARPKPMSTVVRSVDYPVMSRSNFVLSLMDRVKEAKEMCHLEESQPEENILSQKLSTSLTDVSLLKTPRQSSVASLRSCEMIYPEIVRSPLNNPLSAVKRRMDNLENRSLQQVTEECLQLLQTPTRQQPKKSPEAFKGPLHIRTPQSILKMHNLSRSKLQTSALESTRRSSGTLLKKLESSSLHLYTSSQVDVEERSFTGHIPLAAPTPKQLRFVGLSPSPSPTAVRQTTEQESSRLRDTSVTPPIVDEGSATPPPDEMEISGDFHRHLTPVKSSAVNSEDIAAPPVTEQSVEKAWLETGICRQETTSSTSATSLSSMSPLLDVDKKDVDSLVRPDLHPLWQKESPKTAHTEVIVDEEITFQLGSAVSKQSDPHLTAVMTSSPVDMMDFAEPDVSLLTAEDVEIEDEEDVPQVPPHQVDYEKRIQRVGSVLKKAFTKTVVEKKSSVEEVTDIVVTGVSHVLASDAEHHAQTLTVATGEHKASESPPATPPLSQKAKLMARRSSKPVQDDQYPGGEYHKEKTPERKSPSRTRESVPRDQMSPSRALRSADKRTIKQVEESESPTKDLVQTPKRRSPSRRTKLFSEDEPSSIMPARNDTKTSDRKSLTRNEETMVETQNVTKSSGKTSHGVRKSPSDKEIGQSDTGTIPKKGRKSSVDPDGEEVTPDRTILRRSTRVKTPPRDPQTVETQKTVVANQTRSYRKQNAGKNPTGLSDSVSEQTEISGSKSMETLDEEPIVRRTRGKSKTPDRVSVNFDKPETPRRSSQKRLQSSEHLVGAEEPVKKSTLQLSPSRPDLASEEVKPSPSRKSKRKQISPDKFPDASMSPATRKSLRNLRSSEKIPTEQIEPITLDTSSSTRSREKSELLELSLAIQEKRKKRASSIDHELPRRASLTRGRSAEPATPVRGSRVRKTPDITLQALGDDQQHFACTLQSSSLLPADVKEDQMPPLRLEIDEESNESTKDGTKQSAAERMAVDNSEEPDREEENLVGLPAHINLGNERSQPFTFSSPLTHALKKSKKKNPEPDTDKFDKRIFIFSHPALAVDNEQTLTIDSDPTLAIVSDPILVVEREPSLTVDSDPILAVDSEPTLAVDSDPILAVDSEAQGTSSVQNEESDQQNKPKIKRKRQSMYDGSPILLSPSWSPTAYQMAAQRHPTESQRLSASILRRYKPRGPRTRRIKPSQNSSRH